MELFEQVSRAEFLMLPHPLINFETQKKIIKMKLDLMVFILELIYLN